MRCHICNSDVAYLYSQTVLKQHAIKYYRCNNCYFIQTESPYWLDEAYSKAIAMTDIGLVSRNLRLSRVIHSIICTFFNPNRKFIDYGAGYGLLVRLMRDRGFDFYHYDTKCENLMSYHFPASMGPSRSYELLTAIEVFEHLTNPIAEIKKMLSCSDNILFSTMLTPRDEAPPRDWWYFTPQTGQHISLYSIKSLRAIAKRFNLYLSSNHKNIHLLSVKPIQNSWFKFVTHYAAAHAISLLRWRPSFQDDDYRYALKSK